MTGKIIRWILIAIMLCAICLFAAAPSLASVVPLDMDQLTPGRPSQKERWESVPAGDALQDSRVLASGTAMPYVMNYDVDAGTWVPTDIPATAADYDWQFYEDASISVRSEFCTLKPAGRKKAVPAAIVYIRVADPSQIRTAMSYDEYKKKNYVNAEKMAEHVNAIAAINGDFFKYHYDVGYVLRQGVFYRDRLNGKRDVLMIDSRGDFHPVFAATSEAMAAAIDALPENVSAVNTFSLGPVLVQNGTALKQSETITAKRSEFQWCYAQQRVAVVQVDELEYALVETYGKTDSSCGLNLQEFADFIAYCFPDCRLAYNLDGGGSSNVLVDGKRIHVTPGHRQISDILYFASADDPEAADGNN